MKSIVEIENEIIEDFELFEDWEGKYDYLISMGKDLPIIDEKYKTEEYLIKGCQSKVWVNATESNDKIYFTADSDAIITKGIVGLLIHVLSGQSAKDIMDAKLEFIEKIGLKEHLSPSRSNGLVGMIKQMKLYAIAFQNKN